MPTGEMLLTSGTLPAPFAVFFVVLHISYAFCSPSKSQKLHGQWCSHPNIVKFWFVPCTSGVAIMRQPPLYNFRGKAICLTDCQ